jgi:hypothetical protein
MFERGLFIDGNWISNGEAFWRPLGVVQKKFIERFMKDKAGATVQLWPKSKPFLFDDAWPCILLASDKEFILVQVKNLELIGVNLDFLDEYEFWQNPSTHLIYVYNPDLIGGVLPLSADKEKVVAYGELQK